jgi:hypothetical protein
MTATLEDLTLEDIALNALLAYRKREMDMLETERKSFEVHKVYWQEAEARAAVTIPKLEQAIALLENS